MKIVVMHHVAIMKKSWNLIPKILAGEKTIESRWYKTKRAPWNKARKGDVIFFKNTGEPVTVRATVTNVLQFEIKTITDATKIVTKYGKEICLVNTNPASWETMPRYCILLYLENPRKVAPFKISKKGFGAGVAWITIDTISTITSTH